MNRKTALIVDSGSDVPQEYLDRYPIFELPLNITFSDGTYTDKVTITADEIYRRLPTEIPTTSLPDGAVIHQVFDQIKQAGYTQVIAITISSGLSGTYNALRLAGAEQELEFFIYDTRNIGIGSGIQAIQAAEWLEAGVDAAEVFDRLEANREKSKIFFNVKTLEYLRKGGRIGLVGAVLGTALKLTPIITCNEEGIYASVAKVRGRNKSIAKSIQLIEEFIGGQPKFRLAVAHGAALEEAKAIETALKEKFPNVEIFFGQISPALVVHTGPGLLGIGVQLLD